MNPMKTFCFLACLLAAIFATNADSGKPSQWLPASKLESLPAVDQISYQRLENMPAQQGAELINSIYHLWKINHDKEPTFVPSPSSIPAYILTPNGQNVSVNLNQLVNAVKEQQNFGNEEVTIIMTGMPQNSASVRKATQKLVEAYMQRYSAELQEQLKKKSLNEEEEKNVHNPSSSEEDYKQGGHASSGAQVGDVIVINLGQTLQPFKRSFMLDIEKTGAMIGDILVDLAHQANVPEDILHIIGQGPAAHVAGAAGRRYKRQTGRSIRRITGLNPSKLYTDHSNGLTGLARGDADFVDCIHTSAYGLGTATRQCDADFYPNGPSTSMPGTNNIVESSMRATRYFAESVRPGNEHNFPAERATSLKQYKNKTGFAKRVYMGYATEFDVKGDYILEVNARSPFGKTEPAMRHSSTWEQHSKQSNPSGKRGSQGNKKPFSDYE